MDGPGFWKILIAAIGFGVGGELIRQYRRYKARRRERSFAERNAGFWTDRRVYRAEALFCAAAMAFPFTAIILAVWTNGSVVAVYAAILVYAFAVYLLMSALNMREPQ